jgi:hypothetical protein
MNTKRALMRGAAVGVMLAVGFSASAEAATHKRVRRAAAEASETQALKAEVEALGAQVQALQARLDAQGQAAQTAQTQAAQAQQAAAQAQTQVQQVAAENQSVEERLDNVPSQVLQTVADLPKPKPSWADSTVVSGRMYFDLSNINPKTRATAAGGDQKVAPSGTGFDIKRFYLGVDHKFNDTYSANITTDVQYSSAIGATELYIKKAYLQASYDEAFNVRLGSTDLPWIPFVEDLYGYRFVENTLIDRTKYGTSADWGVHVYGKLGPIVSYQVSVVDGAGYKAPLRSKTMDVEGRVSAKYQDFTVAVGGYTGKLGKDVQSAAPSTRHTASRFDAIAAYTHGPVRAGVEYFAAKNWNNVTTAATDKAEGWSGFASYAFTPQWSVFGRYDWVKPNKTTADNRKDNYFNFGLNYEPVKIVDLALVYKRDKVDNGTLSTSNGVIGGAIDGAYDEFGLFGQLRW